MIVVVEVSVGRERQNLYALRLHMDEWQALVCPCTDSGDKDRDGDFKDVCSYLGRSSSSSASPKGTATMTALTSYRSYGSCRSVSRSTIISKAYSF